jgi:hypothetical protein
LYIITTCYTTYPIHYYVLIYTPITLQCIFITIKIYYVFNTITKSEIKNINFYVPLTYLNIFYSIIKIFIVIVGLPILGDTVIEISGDIKYVIEQILLKKKIK